MWLTDLIFSKVWAISDWFYDAYRIVDDWVWPFWLLADPLYWVSTLFRDLLTPIANIGDWIDDVTTQVGRILSMGEIHLYFQYWFDRAEWAWEWITDAWWNVWNITSEWWSSTSQTVLAWIEGAKQDVLSVVNTLETLFASLQTTWDNFWTLTWPQWMQQFDTLAAAWDNFWVTTFPTLATWSGVSTLIVSTIRVMFPFYDELAALWNDIKLFFTDPEDWLYKSVDRIIERFW